VPFIYRFDFNRDSFYCFIVNSKCFNFPRFNFLWILGIITACTNINFESSQIFTKMTYSETCLNQTSFEPTIVFAIDRCSVYTGWIYKDFLCWGLYLKFSLYRIPEYSGFGKGGTIHFRSKAVCPIDVSSAKSLICLHTKRLINIHTKSLICLHTKKLEQWFTIQLVNCNS
jgi:hypothetical protein